MLVYKIANMTNGKGYIGITMGRLCSRWAKHVYVARRGSQLPLARAIRRYGVQSFTIEAIYEATSVKELKAVERGLICAHATHTSGGGGYNRTLGGDSIEGVESRRGERQYRALLTEEVVAYIRDPSRAQLTNREIVEMVAAEFGVAARRDTIRDARRGDAWAHLSSGCPVQS